MNRGCTSLGEVQCDDCQRIITYPERYLAINEQGEVEGNKGKTLRYCLDCCLKKGYARYQVDKGKQVLIFL